MTVPRMLAAVLVATALLAPAAAQAKPVDMRSSVAEALAQERRQQERTQDLRMPDRRDPAPSRPYQADPSPSELNQLAAPTWPVEPEPLTVSTSPAASDGDGIDWATIGIGVGLSVLAVVALGAIAGVSRRGRVRRQERVA